MLRRFNVRVYGLLLHHGHILLVDEKIQEHRLTKFPGGGLELGEGPIDCLLREFHEETGMHIDVQEHIYTTGFFQVSAFSSEDQIISIYYRVEAPSWGTDKGMPLPVAPPHSQESIVRFRWHPLQALDPAHVTLPIDRYVVEHCMPARWRCREPAGHAH